MREHTRKLQDRYVRLYIKANRTLEEQKELQRLRLVLNTHHGKFGRSKI